MTQIKICGLTTPESIHACTSSAVDFIGFVFYPSSPRAVTPEQAASLSKLLPPSIQKVGLFVNPSPEQIRHALSYISLDMIQLHGDESIEFIQTIKSAFNLPVIKAISIATPDDVKQINAYEKISDWILCDAKSTTNIPGGNGTTFDWHILKHYKFQKPWMLSGGLMIDNVNDAITALKPTAIDVSSGVEIVRGVKSPEKIKDFVNHIRYG
jgi:phosphoribosylanthranilate isomerase